MSNQKERAPASVVGGKVPWSPAPIGKHLALIKVELKSSEIPESGSDETTFTGRILVTQDIEGDLNYTWSIPDDVTIVEGSLSESLPNVKKGQIVEVTLTVSGFNKEKQRLVTLQACKIGGSARVFDGQEYSLVFKWCQVLFLVRTRQETGPGTCHLRPFFFIMK
ncbi:hypothetical protein QJS83_10080 [Bdellovibrio sp. 22V]|uniref:hypothetical protein n=1 Tax=Bdellovibrio sp. 22V TaxID=3044166 RepID=UPI002543B00D|nr:hypothetical protein [Bdellovibrio sp. 22V]WII70807.1 hypothetical protein QJS83_10080 [Bdellovibrio sp. 22V]